MICLLAEVFLMSSVAMQWAHVEEYLVNFNKPLRQMVSENWILAEKHSFEGKLELLLIFIIFLKNMFCGAFKSSWKVICHLSLSFLCSFKSNLNFAFHKDEYSQNEVELKTWWLFVFLDNVLTHPWRVNCNRGRVSIWKTLTVNSPAPSRSIDIVELFRFSYKDW